MSRKRYNHILNHKYINGTNHIYEHFSSVNPVVEYGLVSDVSVSKNVSNQESSQSALTNTNTENTTTNTNQTDNSMQMSSDVNSNTQVDSSQTIDTTNTNDNSSIQNINSSTDTYNVDNSQLINDTTMNTTSKLIQSCGMTIEQANAAINIVKDESVNTNIDASNTFIVTGNSNTITDVRLESEINFEGGEIDRSCVLDAVNDMQTELEAINENAKSMTGGEGGEVGAKAGGNTTDNVNTSDKSDQLDASVDASMDGTQAASTINDNTTDNTTENKITTDQSAEQSADQSASAGGITENIIIILVIITLYFVINGNMNFDMKLLNKKNILIILGVLTLITGKFLFKKFETFETPDDIISSAPHDIISSAPHDIPIVIRPPGYVVGYEHIPSNEVTNITIDKRKQYESLPHFIYRRSDDDELVYQITAMILELERNNATGELIEITHDEVIYDIMKSKLARNNDTRNDITIRNDIRNEIETMENNIKERINIYKEEIKRKDLNIPWILLHLRDIAEKEITFSIYDRDSRRNNENQSLYGYWKLSVPSSYITQFKNKELKRAEEANEPIVTYSDEYIKIEIILKHILTKKRPTSINLSEVEIADTVKEIIRRMKVIAEIYRIAYVLAIKEAKDYTDSDKYAVITNNPFGPDLEKNLIDCKKCLINNYTDIFRKEKKSRDVCDSYCDDQLEQEVYKSKSNYDTSNSGILDWYYDTRIILETESSQIKDCKRCVIKNFGDMLQKTTELPSCFTDDCRKEWNNSAKTYKDKGLGPLDLYYKFRKDQHASDLQLAEDNKVVEEEYATVAEENIPVVDEEEVSVVEEEKVSEVSVVEEENVPVVEEEVSVVKVVADKATADKVVADKAAADKVAATPTVVEEKASGMTENIIIALVGFTLYMILNGKNNLDLDRFTFLLKYKNYIIIGIMILFFIMK